MDANEIRQLLVRYYDGQTSEKEDAMLRDYMCGDDLPHDLQEEADVFKAMCSCGSVPEGLEHRISRQIDSWNMVEKGSFRKARVSGIRWIADVAACMLILFSAGMMLHDDGDRQHAQWHDTYDNTEDAYAQTQKALLKMSASINKGLQKMEEVTDNKK